MFQPTSLEGMSIVVTGAARGIGRAIVKRILSLGGKVVAVDLDRAGFQIEFSAHEHTLRHRLRPHLGANQEHQ